ncbi:DedA family protein [Thermoflavimicrobium dichotomicum]|uniref:Membrane protein DedA, SNARE-associated domain n=1 Tax=Thermoflavimicrobium dichotomicum TaxID=46223 RepID=A0A1I3NMU2_9BACL|nr:VTT domain-containing protein [Thermoflavimicrobium dichotomicum]SFJ10535.1 membrane protein DedA, SNARE-associated domain [Thermoflavimicrobium dichotomicum]
MLQYLLDFIKEYGIIALFVATAIEASALPFPGAWVVLIFGLMYPASPWQLVLIGAANGVIFSIFSMIPYLIGKKLEKFTKKKFDPEKIEKTQQWFRKYGEWSIIFSRPLSIGNYISFISGMCNVNFWRYLLFTYMGVFPWNVILLFVGHSGNIDRIHHFLGSLQHVGIILVIVLVATVGVWVFVKRSKKRQQSERG